MEEKGASGAAGSRRRARAARREKKAERARSRAGEIACGARQLVSSVHVLPSGSHPFGVRDADGGGADSLKRHLF